MKLWGSYPTPYGVMVPVHKNDDGEGDLLFCADAVAICAGIHDRDERERFKRDAASAGAFPDRLNDYGGRRAHRVVLPRPIAPVTPNVPDLPEIPLDAWVNAVMDRVRWCDRAEVLIEAISSNLDATDDASFEPIAVLGIRIILASALEHLAEKEIDCLEQAAFYALTIVPEWSRPALEWLEPVADTWWADWLGARPAIGRLAAHCDDLPPWFGRRP